MAIGLPESCGPCSRTWTIFFLTNSRSHRSPAWRLRVPASYIQGAAGAGDAFASGVLFGLHEGGPVDDALRLGVCAAAASLAHPTCSEGVLSRTECLALATRFGFHELSQK